MTVAVRPRPWQAIEGDWLEEDVLVVGNGPSRLGLDRTILDWRGPIVACNSFWKFTDPGPDLLVAFDRAQAEDALRADRRVAGRILLPEQRGSGLVVDPELLASTIQDVIVAEPHDPAAGRGTVYSPTWEPARLAVGNFAGFLAFQAAVLAGAATITLIGIDAAGRLSADGRRVALSAFGVDAAGYENSDVPASACVERDGLPVPPAWDSTLELWRALTDRAKAWGIEVRRAGRGSALTWIVES